MSNRMTIWLEESNKIKLEKQAESTLRTYSFLNAKENNPNLVSQEWQIVEIHQAISEAEACDFATQAQVDAVADKWRIKQII